MEQAPWTARPDATSRRSERAGATEQTRARANAVAWATGLTNASFASGAVYWYILGVSSTRTISPFTFKSADPSQCAPVSVAADAPTENLSRAREQGNTKTRAVHASDIRMQRATATMFLEEAPLLTSAEDKQRVRSKGRSAIRSFSRPGLPCALRSVPVPVSPAVWLSAHEKSKENDFQATEGRSEQARWGVAWFFCPRQAARHKSAFCLLCSFACSLARLLACVLVRLPT